MLNHHLFTPPNRSRAGQASTWNEDGNLQTLLSLSLSIIKGGGGVNLLKIKCLFFYWHLPSLQVLLLNTIQILQCFCYFAIIGFNVQIQQTIQSGPAGWVFAPPAGKIIWSLNYTSLTCRPGRPLTLFWLIWQHSRGLRCSNLAGYDYDYPLIYRLCRPYL